MSVRRCSRIVLEFSDRARCAMCRQGPFAWLCPVDRLGRDGERPDLADGRADRVGPARADDARALPGHRGPRADPAGHAGRAGRRADPRASKPDWARSFASRRRSPSSTAPRRRPGSRWPSAELKEKQALLKARTRPSSGRLPGAGRGRRRRGSSWPSSSSTAAPCAPRSRAGWSPCRSAPVNMSSKGTTIAELADVSSLKTLQPVDRRSVASDAPLTVQVEGQDVAAKVQAILPLPERIRRPARAGHAVRRRLGRGPQYQGRARAGPAGAAPRRFPSTPIATVPKRAVKPEDAAAARA